MKLNAAQMEQERKRQGFLERARRNQERLDAIQKEREAESKKYYAEVWRKDREKRQEQKRLRREQSWGQLLRRWLYILWSPIPRILYCAAPFYFVIALLVCRDTTAVQLFFTSLLFIVIGFCAGTMAFLYNSGFLSEIDISTGPSAIWWNYDGHGYPPIGATEEDFSGYPHL